MAEAFKFELVSPERLVMSENVEAVVVPGAEGDLTVLKGHAPFMTTVRPGFVTVTAVGGKATRLYVRGGFADASPNGLTILAEKSFPAEDLKGDAASNELKLAEGEAAAAKGDDAVAAAHLRLGDVKSAIGTGSAAAH